MFALALILLVSGVSAASVVLDYPTNGDTNSSFNTWNFTPIWEPTTLFDNCTLYINDTARSVNQTNLLNDTTNSITFALAPEGYYEWYIACTNSTTFTNSTTQNVTVDLTAPQISVTNPNPYTIKSVYNFDDGTLHGWSYYETNPIMTGSLAASNAWAYSGTWSADLTTINTGGAGAGSYMSMRQSLDLTGIDTLEFKYLITGSKLLGFKNLSVWIGGVRTDFGDISAKTYGIWYTYSLDVSGDTGVKVVDIGVYTVQDYGVFSNNLYVDDIRLVEGEEFYLKNTDYQINVTYTDNFDLFNCSYDIYFPNGTIHDTNSVACSGTSFTWDNETWSVPEEGFDYIFNFSAMDSHTANEWEPDTWWFDDTNLYIKDNKVESNSKNENSIFSAPPVNSIPISPTYTITWDGYDAGPTECGNGNGNGNNKVLLCHVLSATPHNLCVAQPAVQSHLNHGDYLGACIVNPDDNDVHIMATKLNDRIKFSYIINGSMDLWYKLKIQASDSIDYRSNSALAGHFVINNNNWIDFQDLIDTGFEVEVGEVGDNYAYVSFNPPGTGEGVILADPATGGLNFNSTSINITVYDGVPTADFDITTAAPRWVNAQVQFNDTSTTPNQTSLTNWYWDFGDDSQSTTQNATHTYTEPGIYTVGLIVENNVSSNSSLYTDTITINGFQIDVFDEVSGDPVVNWDLTLSNSTYSKTFNDQNNTLTWDNFTDLPTGPLQISVSADGYPVRYYYDTFGEGSPVDLDAYLLGSADGLYTYFLVQDSTGNPIDQAIITAEFLNGSSWIVATNVLTDQTGSASIWLDFSKNYRVIVSKTGYTSVTRTVTPQPTTYKIILGGGSNYELQNPDDTVWTKLRPTSTTLDNSSVVVSFEAHDPDEGISICKLDFYWTNGTLFQTINETSQNTTCYVSIAPTGIGNETSFVAVPSFSYGSNSWSGQQVYNLYDGGGLIGSSITGLDDYLSDNAKFFLAVVLTLMSGALVTMYLGAGAPLVMFGVSGILYYYHWFGPWDGSGMLWIIAVVAGLAGMYMERRRF